MFRPCVRAHVGSAAFVLLMLCLPGTVLAQQAKVSFRVAPFGTTKSASPLFKIDIVEPQSRKGMTLPSLTLVDTSTGPRLTNLALTMPRLLIGETSVESKFGDQPLPRSFVSSPLAGASVKRPIRGLSFSTSGSTPWSFSVGQLDNGTNQPATSSTAPGIMALAMGLTPTKRVNVAPRLLVPLGTPAAQANLGTAIQAQLTPHMSFVSDVGAADIAHGSWDPLAAAGVIAHWSGAEVETNMVRGAPIPTSQNANTAMVGSVDREVVRGQLRSIPGVTVSALASLSRPASDEHAVDTKTGSVGIAYDRLPYGQLAATNQNEDYPTLDINTTRVEWRHAPVGGFAVRFTGKRQSYDNVPQSTQLARQLEVDFPGWRGQDPGTRLEVHTAITADPTLSPSPTLSSRFTGRVAMFGNVGLAGETEVGVKLDDGGGLVRALRLTSEVPVFRATALQLLYSYRPGMPFVLNQAIEARISRTIKLAGW